jgi:2-polyprenyl-6-methoxyphenol hydroxylase-like FAD-dependent oxidoreductase
MRAEVTGMRMEGDRVTGVHVMTPDGPLEVEAALTVAADGRGSVLRGAAGLPLREIGAPMDVLWFRVSRRPEDPEAPLARFEVGDILVMLNRGEHWQCGYVIPKGALEDTRRRGLEALRGRLGAVAPFLGSRVNEIRSWDDVKLLTVRVDRLERWHRAGLLCIGDAAHAMSPLGGVGINLAIQDAVAAANVVAGPLRDGRLGETDLARVQRRRQWPTRVTQALQVFLQRRLITRALEGRGGPMRAPLAFRIIGRCPLLQRLPARIVGLGIRPERPR